MPDDRQLSPEQQAALVKERRLLEELARDTEIGELRALLELAHFRDFLWRVLTRCHVFQELWDTNYGRMSKLEGERSIGLWLIAELGEADPKALLQMQAREGERRAEATALDAKRRQSLLAEDSSSSEATP